MGEREKEAEVKDKKRARRLKGKGGVTGEPGQPDPSSGGPPSPAFLQGLQGSAVSYGPLPSILTSHTTACPFSQGFGRSEDASGWWPGGR